MWNWTDFVTGIILGGILFGSLGVIFGGMLGMGKREDLERDNAHIKEDLRTRYLHTLSEPKTGRPDRSI